MRMHYQIAVIGAGIAGAACCLRLARLGFRPFWIAPAMATGDKPGELLSAAARPLLGSLDAESLLLSPDHRPAHNMVSAWGSASIGSRSSIVHLEGPQTVLNRAAFEKDLLALAETAGPERREATLAHCSRSGDKWRLVLESGEVTANLVIDATGRKAAVARELAPRFRADRLAAWYGFLDQDPASDVAPTQATLVEAAADGWFYATLLADGRLALNFFSDADLMRDLADGPSPTWRALLASSVAVRRWIDEAGFGLNRRPKLASAATTWLAPCAGTNWLAVGDAAAAFDPLSSHGMTSALWTGIRGAEAAAAMLEGDSRAAKDYAGRVARGVQEFLENRQRIYAQETRFAASEFWRRRQKTVGRDAPDNAQAPASREDA